MQLRRGITGFHHASDPAPQLSDVRAFRTHCYDAAQKVGGQVLHVGLHPNNVTANFCVAILELSEGQVSVLLNRHFPVLGFASPASEGDRSPLRFIDSPELSQVFSTFGIYEVLTRDELERAVGETDLRLLSSSEIEQAAYWKPGRVGDVVFNFWD